QIAIQTWFHPQARGNLLMVHGYYDHVGLYGSIIELCQKHQLNLVCFDLPGHGLSSGEPAAIDSFQTYQRVLQSIFTKASKNLKGSWIGLGQSTGGGILADYALSRTQPEFKQLILMAPLLQPRGWNSGRWVHSLARLFIRRLKRKFGFGGNNPEFSQFVSQDPLQSLYLSVSWVTAMKVWIREMKMKEPVSQPVVLIQGTRDETVDWKHNTRRYSSLFQNLKLHWVEGGHHHLVNETDMRWKQIEKILTDTILENFS
ncbi:MAG: alpha/beta hydrolase, partial [Oceanobacter sp.]